MSYLYDELNQLRKDSGRTWLKIANDLNLTTDIIQKWKNNEPLPKYRDKVLNYIKSERQKVAGKLIIFSPEPKVNVGTKETSKPVVFDENNIPIDFWDILEKIYLSYDKGKDWWANEKGKLKPIIVQIASVLKSKKYSILSPIDIGGTAVILRVRDESLNVERALKFPRPIPEHMDLFNETMGTEISYLLEAHHQNIVELYYRDEVKVEDNVFKFYVMKYVKGAQSAHKYFQAKRDFKDLIRIVKQVVSGLKHLHSLGIVHFDVKPKNILISEEGDALISDLGSARKYSDSDEEVSVIYTKHYAHQRLIAIRSQSTSDSNKNRASIKRKEIDRAFDIYAFGKSLFELVQTFDPNVVTERMKPYERKYLLLMASRCLDGLNTDSETALGLSSEAFSELKYLSFEELYNDIEKLIGEFPLHTLLPELNPYTLRTVQTASNWKTPLTNRLANLMVHPAMQRLAGISELGLLIHIYPTATHTRLQHTLGVFSNTIRIIESLYNDPINPLFKQIMTIKDLESVLLVALFHDMGHFPLAHDLHEALPSIFDHESVAVSILRGEKNWFSGNELRNLVKDEWQIDTKRIAAIIKSSPGDNTQPIKDRILNTIINGPIDADKLDYLIRDARVLNVPYATVIDLERLMSCLTITFMSAGVRTFAALGIHEKGKFSAEAVAFARYAMYGAVYWHHTFRAIKSMLHRVVWETRLDKYQRGDSSLEADFQSRFFESIMAPPLFEEGSLDLLTQILPTDWEILNWFYSKTTPKGKALLKMLNSRSLYKRVCVLSSPNPLREKLIDFRKTHTDCSKYVTLQNRIQEEIIIKIRHLTEYDRSRNSTLTIDNTDKVIKLDNEGTILFLLDIPSEKFGSDSPLMYLPESARQSLLQNWDAPVNLEESKLWKELNDNLLTLIGKVRLFAHPEIANVINAVFTKREELESIIQGALDYVKSKI